MERSRRSSSSQHRRQFQFPSNGKVHGKYEGFDCLRRDRSDEVSIPFKREGTWKAIPLSISASSLDESFQFPSNGKVHGKTQKTTKRRSRYQRVSIPFKREGTWKETLFSTQTGRGSKHPKTKHELRGTFFPQKFTPKTPRTLINTQPNTIFY